MDFLEKFLNIIIYLSVMSMKYLYFYYYYNFFLTKATTVFISHWHRFQKYNINNKKNSCNLVLI